VVVGLVGSIEGTVIAGDEPRTVGAGDGTAGSEDGNIEAGGRLLTGLPGHLSRATTVVHIPVPPQLLPLPGPPQRGFFGSFPPNWPSCI
jgi:hypothetical protein